MVAEFITGCKLLGHSV